MNRKSSRKFKFNSLPDNTMSHPMKPVNTKGFIIQNVETRKLSKFLEDSHFEVSLK